ARLATSSSTREASRAPSRAGCSSAPTARATARVGQCATRGAHAPVARHTPAAVRTAQGRVQRTPPNLADRPRAPPTGVLDRPPYQSRPEPPPAPRAARAAGAAPGNATQSSEGPLPARPPSARTRQTVVAPPGF